MRHLRILFMLLESSKIDIHEFFQLLTNVDIESFRLMMKVE